MAVLKLRVSQFRRFHGDVITPCHVGIRHHWLVKDFCLDSCLVYINFAHTQDHNYVLYLCEGTSVIVWTARFSLSSKKKENEENSG